MFDRHTTALTRPAIDTPARGLVRLGIRANALTFTGRAVGWLAALAIAFQATLIGAIPILVSRLFDGLDGAVARQTWPTNRGGFLADRPPPWTALHRSAPTALDNREVAL